MAQLRRQIEDIDEEFADDEAYDRAESDALEAASSTTRALSGDELAALDQLQRFADRASAQADEKAKELIAWLQTSIRPNDKWTDQRVIIFTEFRATQKWLFELLAARGFARDDRLLLLFGGMPKDKREEIKAAFQARPDQANVRILLATDAASEGIDLQNHCSKLIHYEIPWNPNRLEQRNGRIDRHGQRADEVQVFHFVPAGFDAQDLEGRHPGDLDGDLEFLARAVHKVQAIREDLGKVGPVIAQQVEDAMLGVRARPLDTRDAERQAEPIKRMLTFERRLQEELERFREQLDETKRELHLAPERVHAAVDTALALAGQPPLIPSHRDGIWPDPTGQRRQCPVFELPALRGAWGRCTVGLEHPHTKERRPVVFDPVLAKGRDDVVLAHLNHPLVDMSLRLLRAEIWKSGDNRAISRVTARLVPDTILDAPAVIGHARLVILGGDGHRLHEELLAAGGRIEQGRFRRMVQDAIMRTLAVATDQSTDPGFNRDVAELWPRLSQDLVRALEVRVNERTRNLEERFAARAEEEVQRLQRTILEELARRIREELHAEPPAQLDLFTADEREQRERDRGGLEARLAEIPDEIERESKALRARFADPTPHRFDVGVTFLAPESMAR
jgi:Helicase conserved C-terminal domain